MFTGIVESMGQVVRLLRRGGGARLEIRAVGLANDTPIGGSIAVNGACVTVTSKEGEVFACDLVPETLARTNLGTLVPGEEVNLERPMRVGDRLDGHIVQGHVDVVGLVRSKRRVGAQEVLEINVPFELTRYLAPKGSVSVDGVSLTLVDVNKDRFRVALIPHTVSTTTLGRKIQGQTVNVEVDVLSKYVERHVAARAPRPHQSLAELVRGPLVVRGAETPPAPQRFVPPPPKVSSKPPPKPKAPVRRVAKRSVKRTAAARVPARRPKPRRSPARGTKRSKPRRR
jgi:riboflavin synthase